MAWDPRPLEWTPTNRLRLLNGKLQQLWQAFDGEHHSWRQEWRDVEEVTT